MIKPRRMRWALYIANIKDFDGNYDVTLRAMTHGAVFVDSARSSTASDGIKHIRRCSPTGGRFADSACRLQAVQ
jgi:hypothetical protein